MLKLTYPTTRRSALTAIALTAVSVVACTSGLTSAQAYPTKPVTIIVSYPAGGDTDALGRLFAEKLTSRLGQQVIVENKPGASGTIGNAYVAKSAPDGHTILLTPNTITTALMVLKPGTGSPYDVQKDLAPIIQVGSQSLFLAVNSSTGIKEFKELLAAVKADKIKSYSSPGSGSPMHILGEVFNRAAGTKIALVPYRGSAPAIADLVGGHVPFTYTTLGPINPHVQKGTVAVLAVADAKRSPLSPNTPTLAELGIKDVEVGAWQGLMVPRGTPEVVIRTLNGHMNDILKMPDVQQRLTTIALVPVGGEPSTLKSIIDRDVEHYAKVIKELGITAD